jgi:murein DD-endopeptidase MepM/ murein hydrolase activator NlpD
MSHTDETFTPRQSGLSPVLERAGTFFDRYLTLISIAIAAIGLILLIAGPVRGLLDRQPALTGNDGPITAFQNQGAGLAALNSQSLFERLRLDRDLTAYTIIPDRPRDQVITYMIKRGDTLFGIAATFGLNPNTIFWANSDILGDSVHTILPGIELFILPVDGVYYRSDGEANLQSIASLYEADVTAIIDSPYNRDFQFDQPTDVPTWGTRVVVPGGQREIVDYRVPEVEVSSGGRVTSFMPGMGGSCGSFVGSGGTGAWITPVAPGAYTLTQGFYPGHSGVDLAAVEGTAVRAADTGVVAFSGWVNADWGYGILVVLDHGNGWTTYYAHLSANSVGCGSLAQRGATIGAVGSTGNSTGAHLHFEMRWGHTPDNPVNYIGF